MPLPINIHSEHMNRCKGWKACGGYLHTLENEASKVNGWAVAGFCLALVLFTGLNI